MLASGFLFDLVFVCFPVKISEIPFFVDFCLMAGLISTEYERAVVSNLILTVCINT